MLRLSLLLLSVLVISPASALDYRDTLPFHGAEVIESLRGLLHSEDPAHQWAALVAIQHVFVFTEDLPERPFVLEDRIPGLKAMLPRLSELLRSEMPYVRSSASRLMVQINGGIPELLAALQDTRPEIRYAAAEGLAFWDFAAAGVPCSQILPLLKDDEQLVRSLILRILENCGDIDPAWLADHLISLARDGHLKTNDYDLIQTFGRLGAPAVEPVLELLRSSDRRLVILGLKSLAAIGSPAWPVFDELMNHTSQTETGSVWEALVKIAAAHPERVPEVLVAIDGAPSASRHWAIGALKNVASPDERTRLFVREQLEGNDHYDSLTAAEVLLAWKWTEWNDVVLSLLIEYSSRSEDVYIRGTASDLLERYFPEHIQSSPSS